MVTEYVMAVVTDIDEYICAGPRRFGQTIISHGFKAVGKKSLGAAAAADRLFSMPGISTRWIPGS
jgi:hypothetical protein